MVAGIFGLQFFSDVPKVRTDICQVRERAIFLGNKNSRHEVVTAVYEEAGDDTKSSAKMACEGTLLVRTRVRREWLIIVCPCVQKLPIIGDYFVKEIPPSDNVSFFAGSFSG